MLGVRVQSLKHFLFHPHADDNASSSWYVVQINSNSAMSRMYLSCLRIHSVIRFKFWLAIVIGEIEAHLFWCFFADAKVRALLVPDFALFLPAQFFSLGMAALSFARFVLSHKYAVPRCPTQHRHHRLLPVNVTLLLKSSLLATFKFPQDHGHEVSSAYLGGLNLLNISSSGGF